MATLLTTTIHDPEEGINKNWRFEVAENFDQVLEKVCPTQMASSALEARELVWYTKPDGKRIYMPPQYVIAAEEDTELE